MTFYTVAILIALAAAGYYAGVRYQRYKNQPRRQCDCGKMVPESKVHKLVDTGGGTSEIQSIGGYGSGTAMIAYFCAEHCPGGCNKEHK